MADCQAPIFRNFFDAVIEKGVIDALVAGDNPWSICDQSKSLIQNTIRSARKASNKFISISFHSPIVRLRHLLDEDYNVTGKFSYSYLCAIKYNFSKKLSSSDGFLYL